MVLFDARDWLDLCDLSLQQLCLGSVLSHVHAPRRVLRVCRVKY